MSTATISYSSLKNAANEAKSVSKKLANYADSLNSSVYKKLNSYSGSYTGNISNAKSKTNSKISSLRSKATAYSNYANDLSELKSECSSVDTSVKSMVSKLTANFKISHGINNNAVVNGINYFLTSFTNSTAAGRWVNNTIDKAKSVKEYIRQSIEDWWDYEGGKELVKGLLVGLLEVVIGVCTIVGAILTGGALIVIIAGVVAGIIATANGMMNIWNETKAYSTTYYDDDPATGRRRSDINTWQDYLRSSFYYGDDGEKYEYNSLLYNIATGIDVVNLVCTAITFVNSVGKLIKNGFKWAAGCTSQLKDLKVKDILFSKENWSAFFGKIKDTASSLKMGDFQVTKLALMNFKTDFINNLKASFGNFDTLKTGFSSVKNIASASKHFISDGIDIKNIMTDFILPGIAITSVVTINEGSDGQMKIDFSNILAKDFYSIFDTIKSKIIGSPVFSSDTTIDSSLLETFSKSCNIEISIPEIHIPDMNLSVLRAA